MSTTVQKWGNSLGIRIPRDAANRINLKAGTRVDVIAEEGRIVVQPVTVPTLDELLDRVTPGARPELADWGRPVGKEVW